MVYRPDFQSQFGWGTTFDNQNCTMAVGALLLDRHTLGRIKTNAPALRRLSGVGKTPDGTSMTDMARAIERGWGIRVKNPGPYEPFERFEAKVRAGRGAAIAGDCAIIRGKTRCPAGLSANHAIYVNEVDDLGNFLVYDVAERTASEGVFTIKRNTLKRYAGNWAGSPGMVNAAYSRRTKSDGGTSPLPEIKTPDLSGFGVLGVVAIFGVAIVVGAVVLFLVGSRVAPVMEDQ